MNETLMNSLEPGEKLLWTAGVEPFETLDRTHKKIFTNKLITAIAVALVFTVAYVIFAVQQHMSVNLIMLLIVYALAAIGPSNLLADGKRLKKISYAVTDRRLLAFRDSAYAVGLDQIHTGAFRKDADGHVSLLLGRDGLKVKPHKWRETALVGRDVEDEGAGECLRWALYAPADLEGLKAVLKEKLPFLTEE